MNKILQTFFPFFHKASIKYSINKTLNYVKVFTQVNILYWDKREKRRFNVAFTFRRSGEFLRDEGFRGRDIEQGGAPSKLNQFAFTQRNRRHCYVRINQCLVSFQLSYYSPPTHTSANTIGERSPDNSDPPRESLHDNSKAMFHMHEILHMRFTVSNANDQTRIISA